MLLFFRNDSAANFMRNISTKTYSIKSVKVMAAKKPSSANPLQTSLTKVMDKIEKVQETIKNPSLESFKSNSTGTISRLLSSRKIFAAVSASLSSTSGSDLNGTENNALPTDSGSASGPTSSLSLGQGCASNTSPKSGLSVRSFGGGRISMISALKASACTSKELFDFILNFNKQNVDISTVVCVFDM